MCGGWRSPTGPATSVFVLFPNHHGELSRPLAAGRSYQQLGSASAGTQVERPTRSPHDDEV
jgi:hypothetical protein